MGLERGRKLTWLGRRDNDRDKDATRKCAMKTRHGD